MGAIIATYLAMHAIDAMFILTFGGILAELV